MFLKNLKCVVMASLLIFIIHDMCAIIVVSLGSDCTVASLLRDRGVRKVAYPFDWMFSDFDSICQAFEDDFKLFLDPSSLRVSEDKRIVCDAYGFRFVHDFPTVRHEAAAQEGETHDWAEIRSDWRNFITVIYEKYHRRIDRLRAEFSGSDCVFLVRYSIHDSEREKVIKLRDTLSNRYPNLNFTLVMVTQQTNEPEQWQLEKIKHYCIPYGCPDMNERWLNIFNSLGINLTGTRSGLIDEDEDGEGICDGTCYSDALPQSISQISRSAK